MNEFNAVSMDELTEIEWRPLVHNKLVRPSWKKFVVAVAAASRHHQEVDVTNRRCQAGVGLRGRRHRATPPSSRPHSGFAWNFQGEIYEQELSTDEPECPQDHRRGGTVRGRRGDGYAEGQFQYAAPAAAVAAAHQPVPIAEPIPQAGADQLRTGYQAENQRRGAAGWRQRHAGLLHDFFAFDPE